MKTKTYPAGSEFRRWDLHVHTPASFVQSYGGDNRETWEKYFEALRELSKRTKVLGINDYIFIDGYRRVKSEFDKGNLGELELILPIIELRVNRYAANTGAWRRINFHAVFSNEVSPDDIQAQFINGLSRDFKLSPELDSTKIRFSGMPTRKSLEDFGNQIIASSPPGAAQGLSALRIGFDNFTVDLENLRKLLRSSYFEDKYLTALGKNEWGDFKWTPSSVGEKKDIINDCDFVLLSCRTVEHYNKALAELKSANVNSRLLDASDSHDFADSSKSDRLGNSFTWIKADPTFDGLKLALREFDDRVWIGDEPPKHEARRKTPERFFHSISIKKTPNSDLQENWFDVNELPLNSNLIAIIGGKGSGKSALAETISLLSNTESKNRFSFLHKDRFRKHGKNLAKHFDATLSFCCTNVRRGSLAYDLVDETPAAVALPQSYVDDICNDIDHEKSFQAELEKVIFDHLPDEQRRGATDLQELMNRLNSLTASELREKRNKVADLNKQIVRADEKATKEHEAKLLQEFREKWRQWKGVLRQKPPIVKKPGDFESENEPLIQELEVLDNLIEDQRIKLEEAARQQKDATDKLEAIDRVEMLLEKFKRHLDALDEALAPTLSTLNLNRTALFSVKTDFSALDQLKTEAEVRRKQALAKQDPLATDSPGKTLADATDKKREIQTQLNEPQRLYARHLDELEDWRSRRIALRGSEELPGSIRFLLKQIRDARSAEQSAKELRQTRDAVGLEIVTLLRRISEQRAKLFEPVQKKIDSHPILRDKFNFVFETELACHSFSDTLFSKVNRQRSGSFYGAEQGTKRLRELEEAFPPSVEPVEFARSVEKALQRDQRDGSNEPRQIADQLKSHSDASEVLDFLFQFEYLVPKYSISLAGNPVSLLSPGEKGVLLLIFYLLVDKRDVPLIIDQPEENLDNQTVYDFLVPAIKEAKKRRQVVIVTHNPNLAVVCDAEQIIHAERDPNDGNRITYTSGSIESPAINRKLLNVLEGTKPAFNNRRDKYWGTLSRSDKDE